MKISSERKALNIVKALIIFSLLASCKDDVKIAQILTNTDVETGSLQPNNWFSSVPSNYAAEWTVEEASSKTHSLKITAANAVSPDFAYWSQGFSGEMPYGKDLILSVKIKAKNLDGQGVSVALRADSATPSAKNGSTFITTQSDTPISGTFDWTAYTVRMNGLRTDAKVIYVFLVYLPNTTGTAYFDDVTVTHN